MYTYDCLVINHRLDVICSTVLKVLHYLCKDFVKAGPNAVVREIHMFTKIGFNGEAREVTDTACSARSSHRIMMKLCCAARVPPILCHCWCSSQTGVWIWAAKLTCMAWYSICDGIVMLLQIINTVRRTTNEIGCISYIQISSDMSAWCITWRDHGNRLNCQIISPHTPSPSTRRNLNENLMLFGFNVLNGQVRRSIKPMDHSS